MTLVKPQFEVGRYQVGKGGIVKDEERIKAVIDDIRQFGEQSGLRAAGHRGGAEGEREKEQGVLHSMGKVKLPPPVQFFASIIFGDSGILSHVEAELAQLIGPIAERTDIVSFSQSGYYRPEMGEGLRRYFLLFEPLLEREHARGHQARRQRDRAHGCGKTGGGRSMWTRDISRSNTWSSAQPRGTRTGYTLGKAFLRILPCSMRTEAIVV